jgi:hypothetical protein
VRRRSGRWNRDVSNEPRAIRQRGWSALLAVLLLVTGAGLGGPSGLAHALRDAAQAGSGAADGRDPAFVRTGSRPTILAQRSGDPSSLPAPVEPALSPEPSAAFAAHAGAVPHASQPAADRAVAPPHGYEARAPPPASA